MFGVDNMCWISAKATLEASRLAELLILQTGMTAFGKAYYRNQSDLVPNVCLLDVLNLYLSWYYVQWKAYLNITVIFIVLFVCNSLQPNLKLFEMNSCVLPWKNVHLCWEKIIQLWRPLQVILIDWLISLNYSIN